MNAMEFYPQQIKIIYFYVETFNGLIYVRIGRFHIGKAHTHTHSFNMQL